MTVRDLRRELDVVLDRIRHDRFGGREAPFVSLREGTGLGQDGRIAGGFDICIRRRDGAVATLYSQSLDGIADRRSLHDAFAEALSSVLAAHDEWPR